MFTIEDNCEALEVNTKKFLGNIAILTYSLDFIKLLQQRRWTLTTTKLDKYVENIMTMVMKIIQNIPGERYKKSQFQLQNDRNSRHNGNIQLKKLNYILKKK